MQKSQALIDLCVANDLANYLAGWSIVHSGTKWSLPTVHLFSVHGLLLLSVFFFCFVFSRPKIDGRALLQPINTSIDFKDLVLYCHRKKNSDSRDD